MSGHNIYVTRYTKYLGSLFSRRNDEQQRANEDDWVCPHRDEYQPYMVEFSSWFLISFFCGNWSKILKDDLRGQVVPSSFVVGSSVAESSIQQMLVQTFAVSLLLRHRYLYTQIKLANMQSGLVRQNLLAESFIRQGGGAVPQFAVSLLARDTGIRKFACALHQSCTFQSQSSPSQESI